MHIIYDRTDAPSASTNVSPRKSGPSRFQDTSFASPAKDNRNAGLLKRPWEDGTSPAHHLHVMLTPPYIVPIYDGTRLKEADFSKVMAKLRRLPVMDEEMPPNSYAVVGFNVTATAPNARNKHPDLHSVRYNVQWALLLATPN